MLRKLIVIVGFIGAFVVMPVLIFSILGALRPDVEKKPPDQRRIALSVATAEKGRFSLQVSSFGEVRPKTDISLSARVAGMVVEVADTFGSGGAFRKGDILMRIESIDYELAIATAKARKARAGQEYALEKARAEAALIEWKSLNQGREPPADSLALRKPQLAAAKAEYEAAAASVKSAELQLERTVMRAPFDGRVRERLVGKGDYVMPGTPVGRLFSSEKAKIKLPLTDADLGKLGTDLWQGTQAQPVRLSAVLAGEPQEWFGEMQRVDQIIETGTGSIYATVFVEDPYGKGSSSDGAPLLGGLFVDATIVGRSVDSAVRIPREAVRDLRYVYIVGPDDILSRRQVEVADISDKGAIITAGLQGGEYVVTSQLNGATTGEKVRMIMEGEPLRAVSESAAADLQPGIVPRIK